MSSPQSIVSGAGLASGVSAAAAHRPDRRFIFFCLQCCDHYCLGREATFFSWCLGFIEPEAMKPNVETVCLCQNMDGKMYIYGCRAEVRLVFNVAVG